MEELIEFIKGSVNIPYVSEMDAVFDGCFTLEPFMISALRGDGTPVCNTDHYQLNVFYIDRGSLLRASEKLYAVLNKHKGCACEDPSLSYETSINLWRAVFTVQKVSMYAEI